MFLNIFNQFGISNISKKNFFIAIILLNILFLSTILLLLSLFLLV